jgi:hypothetical protein
LKHYCTLVGEVEDGSKGRKLPTRRGKHAEQVWSDLLIADGCGIGRLRMEMEFVLYFEVTVIEGDEVGIECVGKLEVAGCRSEVSGRGAVAITITITRAGLT